MGQARPFVHLRTHSAYSILEGACQIEELKELCLKGKMPALALTDTNNLFGALEFSEKFSKEGIQPVVGITLSVSLENTTGARPDELSGSICLLAATRAGYLNLMALASQIWLENDGVSKPAVPLHSILERSEGLIALSGGPEGMVNSLFVHDKDEEACALLKQLHEVFSDRFYIELQRHGLNAEQLCERKLISWAYENEVALVATHQPFFADPGQYRAHDALLCIADSTYVSVEDRRKVSQRHYFTKPHEMNALFADLPEALDNTVQIAKRCSYRPRTHDPILPNFTGDEGRSEKDELNEQARAGLANRLKKVELAADRKVYEERLDFELRIIEEMGFPGYFLIVADFIKWSKSQNIPVGPGRGSGAGSLVAWALTITDLDPIRFGLLFERFLNPERVSMPDFDIDFCQERRGEVIDYVREKYGADRVAQIITFGTLQARAALRDVGRVLQLPLGQVDRLAKMIPNNPADPVTLKQAISGEPRLRRERDEDQDVAMLLDTAMELEGLVRNASTHAAGVVIGDRPLQELTPLYLDPRSEIPATQFNMKWAENAGLVKFDFLGLKTLTVIDRALGFIRETGVEIDIDALPLDDAKTYQLLRDADTIGVFQLESAGMRDTLRKAAPDCFEDIIAIIALYRPGPMDNISKFVACKFGHEKPIHLHDSITPVVADTYGVIIYQEQVMQIAQVLSGYSLGEADMLRRAMGKKIKSEMAAQRARFVDGAVENGVKAKRADEIFDIVDKFAGYGFNKSHSAAYALIGYQTAWLKAHYPVEFYAASMSLDLANTDKLAQFHQDAKRHNIEILLPDVNTSLADFSVKDGKLCYALGAIRNVGLQAMQQLVAIRNDGGSFADLYQFADRVSPSIANRRAIENLAKAGAFSSIEENGNKVLSSAAVLQSASVAAEKSRTDQQDSLFGDAGMDVGRPPLKEVEPWTNEERMELELYSIGFYFSGHPLDQHKQLFEKLNLVFCADCEEMVKDGKSGFRMIGIIRKCQERVSAKSGRRYAYLTCSDPQGEFELLVPGKVLESKREELEVGKSRVFRVKAESKSGEVTLFLDGVESLDTASAKRLKGLRIKIKDGSAANDIREHMQTLATKPDTALGELTLLLDLHGGEKIEVNVGGRWPMDASAQTAIMGIAGVEKVEEIAILH